MSRSKQQPRESPQEARRRDAIATVVLGTLIASNKPSTFSEASWDMEVSTLAKRAVRAADILLEELDRPGEETP